MSFNNYLTSTNIIISIIVIILLYLVYRKYRNEHTTGMNENESSDNKRETLNVIYSPTYIKSTIIQKIKERFIESLLNKINNDNINKNLVFFIDLKDIGNKLEYIITIKNYDLIKIDTMNTLTYSISREGRKNKITENMNNIDITTIIDILNTFKEQANDKISYNISNSRSKLVISINGINNVSKLSYENTLKERNI
jgi:hypothetical protein